MARPERKDYYTVVRYRNTEIDWRVDVENVETIYATWTEAVKLAKAKYTVRGTSKRHGEIRVV